MARRALSSWVQWCLPAAFLLAMVEAAHGVALDERAKLEAVNDVLQTKLVKRGISLMSLEYGKEEPAHGMSVRQVVTVQAGISKEKGKAIIAAIKDTKMRVQAQIQDEQVRVTGKKRDDLQECITFLKSEQEKLQVPMQFGNFRD